MNEHEFRELSAARALHALSPDEEQAFSAALVSHPEWRGIVDDDTEVSAALGEAATSSVRPPAAVRSALLDAIASMPQDGAASSVAPPTADQAIGAVPDDDGDTGAGTAIENTKRRWRAGLFALAASAAVLLALALTPWLRESLAPADPVQRTLEQVESAPDAALASATLEGGGEATLHWSPSADLAVFVAEGVPALDAGRDFELWIVRGDKPISLGVVAADDEHRVAVIPEGFEAGDALAITVEDEGGSPTGAPTTDPIAVVSSV